MIKDIFGNIVTDLHAAAKKKKPANLQAMTAHNKLVQINGSIEGKKCKQCRFLVQHLYGNTVYKCAKSNYSNSAATDWRTGWQACGLFQE
jgi:hypothetical protein